MTEENDRTILKKLRAIEKFYKGSMFVELMLCWNGKKWILRTKEETEFYISGPKKGQRR